MLRQCQRPGVPGRRRCDHGGSDEHAAERLSTVVRMAGADMAGHGAREPHFDIVVRGYNTRQVNERVTRLEFDLRNALAKAGELTRKLASAPVSGADVSERVGMMMSLAQEEIGDLRRAAAEQADAVRAEADRYAADQRATAERVAAEQQEYRRHLEAQHQQLVARLTSEHQSLSADLAERGRNLQEKYTKHHDALDQEYETLRATLAKEHTQLMAQARAEADRLVRQAREQAAVIAREAEEAAQRRTSAADARVSELRALHERFRDEISSARTLAHQAVEHLSAQVEVP